MVYRDFKGIKLSALGLGTMRLPRTETGAIDEEHTRRMIKYALSHGINYFDTAYMYHDGNSELVMGKLLSEYPRDFYYLADKFPGFSEETLKAPEQTFETQLKKCRVDYFDFYLFHNVTERNVDAFLSDSEYHVKEYLLEQKRNGRVKYLGFSCHGTYDTMKRFLDAMGDAIDFCQLQVNWFDWTYQDAKRRVELLRERNIPLWVMEPLRGGKLVDIGDKYISQLKALRPEETVPAWGFRFLENAGATMVLSGMSNMEQLDANIETFSADAPLNGGEMDTLLGIADDMQRSNMMPCTSCRYCTTVCPVGIDIPRVIEIFNRGTFTGVDTVTASSFRHLDEGRTPADCLGCGACEGICPQSLGIPALMEKLAKKL